ncbi:MAG: hypothetical protein OEQ39_26050 [Gammaproteobacteria bacterium]|nr:hypothetical protein [Gammaproteobacteria bacterium]MDH3464923.1 hypothetical protein [Gammaproteobacteria bacterium]
MSRPHTIHVFKYCVLATLWPALSFSAGQLVPSDIVNRFDELEIESIDTNISVALETLPDLSVQTWFSASNQASGTIKILRSYEIDSSMCRELQIVSKQDGFADQRTVSFCQDADLDWHPLAFKLEDSDRN